MSSLCEQIEVIEYSHSFYGNAKGTTSSGGLVNFRHIQLDAVTAIRYADFVGEIAIAFSLEYRTAVGNIIAGGIWHTASEIPVRLIINPVIRSAALTCTHVNRNHDVRRIGWDVTSGFFCDHAHFAFLSAPAVTVWVCADVTADGVSIFRAAIQRTGINQRQHFLGVAFAHDAHSG